MEFNFRTKQYLQEVGATLVSSTYKVFQVDFINMKAYINKQDTYKKRNGKTCHVEHHFGRWIPFKKEDVSYGVRNYTKIESSLYGLETIKGSRQSKYLTPEVKKRLVDEYISTIKK